MKNVTKDIQNNIKKKPYLTIQDIYEYLPIGIKQASKIFHEIEKEMEADGTPNFITRPRVVSARYFFARYHWWN